MQKFQAPVYSEQLRRVRDGDQPTYRNQAGRQRDRVEVAVDAAVPRPRCSPSPRAAGPPWRSGRSRRPAAAGPAGPGTGSGPRTRRVQRRRWSRASRVPASARSVTMRSSQDGHQLYLPIRNPDRIACSGDCPPSISRSTSGMSKYSRRSAVTNSRSSGIVPTNSSAAAPPGVVAVQGVAQGRGLDGGDDAGRSLVEALQGGRQPGRRGGRPGLQFLAGGPVQVPHHHLGGEFRLLAQQRRGDPPGDQVTEAVDQVRRVETVRGRGELRPPLLRVRLRVRRCRRHPSSVANRPTSGARIDDRRRAEHCRP